MLAEGRIEIGGRNAEVLDAEQFEFAYPRLAQVLRDAGIELTNLSAVTVKTEEK